MKGQRARTTGLVAAALLLLPACKSISPAVVEEAGRDTSWYGYMPARAPGFCLHTRQALVWKDDLLPLGYWRARHPDPPHRVLMEARGNTFILHRNYVWDGNSVGTTYPADMLPSLRHDALYHAMKEGVPISRRDVDRAYFRDMRRATGKTAPLHYAAVRLFGGLFNTKGKDEPPTLLWERTTPDMPPAPIEPPADSPIAKDN